ncbi:phosphatase PAP2 family protein [Natronorubrum thiooxidans]|uniref:Membrane-associated phospholipid phosphatase n=1 Tax=Natronorubrum thiooxidans TaxID=308853 RepID=A0A1N7GRB9_9EURY|nr:phosphatase PAP2 family protein [Natronorubrum thiooxidans]SIS15114.1 Membrane-associated phospholipid phosphatase [Natronorubrum thiooxidans]
MSRGLGVVGQIQELIPDWAAILVALVTQLGDAWFFVVLVGGLYWVYADEREDATVVAGLALAGYGLITTLKHVFALPRPEQPLVALESLPALLQPLYEVTAMASSYGFPSGHALMTTVVYGSLARRLSIGTPRRRLLAAVTVVTAVCLSRVALGVHYLVDVVAGVGVGLAFLFVVERLLARYPTRQRPIAFSLAVVLSVVALVTSNADPDAVLLLAGSVGVFGGWHFARAT